MTDEEINIALSRECSLRLSSDGWVSSRKPFFKALETGDPGHPCYGRIPNYCHDLNAMYEAEETLSETQLQSMASLLCGRDDRTTYENRYAKVMHTSARQRAEAFLRTIGKWQNPTSISSKKENAAQQHKPLSGTNPL